MKRNLSILACAGLLGFAGTSVADPIYLDLGNDFDGDGNSTTSVFELFTMSLFDPTSTYFDDAGPNNGVSFGDTVIDIGSTTVGQLNPLGFGDSKEGFNDDWGLSVDWQLIGSTVIGNDGVGSGAISDGIYQAGTGEVLGASFFGGTVDFTIDDPSGNSGFANGSTVLSIDVLSSTVDTTNGISLDIPGQVGTAADDFAFFASGQDFYDLMQSGSTINAFADMELDADNDPTPVASTTDINDDAIAFYESVNGAGSASGFDLFDRTTTLKSANLSFSVPTPATLALLGIGLLGLGWNARSRVRKA